MKEFKIKEVDTDFSWHYVIMVKKKFLYLFTYWVPYRIKRIYDSETYYEHFIFDDYDNAELALSHLKKS